MSPKVNDRISEERLVRYLRKTEFALRKVKISAPQKSFLKKIAEDFYKMAESYYKDAVYFYEKGDFVNAFACINYAHAWLDAGVRLGFFDAEEDYELFTLYE
ncbi:MAG: DUF357 domain-containing protein [Thermoplasmata archaeon]|nr:DUF357 domain-containing protein [Euryarchaeota archaeon]RLF66432.1 MAG: DUF357 domain-containing protein [Thermoplasmata archaeon]